MISSGFTRFPIGGYRRTQYITSIGLNFNVWGVFWRVSDCEELSGSYLEVLCLCEELVFSQEMMRLVLGYVLRMSHLSADFQLEKSR